MASAIQGTNARKWSLSADNADALGRRGRFLAIASKFSRICYQLKWILAMTCYEQAQVNLDLCCIATIKPEARLGLLNNLTFH